MPTYVPARLLDSLFTVAVTDKSGRTIGTLVGSEAGIMGIQDGWQNTVGDVEAFQWAADQAGIPCILTDNAAALGEDSGDYAPDFYLVTDAVDLELAGIFGRIKEAAARAAGSIKEAISRAGIRFTVPTTTGEPIVIDPSKGAGGIREVARSVGVRVEVPPAAPSERVTAAASMLSPAGWLDWYKSQSTPVKVGIPLAALYLLRGKLL